MRTKTCDNGHQEITFSYISELEECPFCKLIEEHRWTIEELNEDHETEVYELNEEVNGLTNVILIANKHLSSVE